MFWGFVASMYVGNLMLLALNLPLVGLFVNLLRIPYAYLYPLIIMFCVIGVYEVNHSIVDVWIMLIMGVVGYGLKKFGFDPAPLVLGLVIAPLFEMSLRQSLIMSNGNWLIFLQRPIALTLIVVCAVLLAMSALSMLRAQRDWRAKLAEESTKESARPSNALGLSARPFDVPNARVCGKLRIDLRQLRRDRLAHQPQCLGADGAGVTGTSSGRSKSKPVFSMISSTVGRDARSPARSVCARDRTRTGSGW